MNLIDMKYHLTSTKEFRRQYKKLERSGKRKALEGLDDVVQRLKFGEILPEKYRNHLLKGVYQDCFECHILSDWLLIYRKYEDILVLELIATGAHSELF